MWPQDNWPCFWILTFYQSYWSMFILLTLSTNMTCQKPQTTAETLSCDDRFKPAMESYWNNPGHPVWSLPTHFQVAHSTLQDQLAGTVSCTEEMTSHHCLSTTETKVLAEHAAEIQKLHFPLTPQDIRLEAVSLVLKGSCCWSMWRHTGNQLV